MTKAAATAGVPIRELPPGTEYVYPGVARIGAGPIVNWQWRTDLVARFQRVMPDTAVFDSSSEEGAMLVDWGFKTKMLGYLPNVRGVITGMPETTSPRHLKVRIRGLERAVVLRPKR
jgi:hypothetical protein